MTTAVRSWPSRSARSTGGWPAGGRPLSPILVVGALAGAVAAGAAVALAGPLPLLALIGGAVLVVFAARPHVAVYSVLGLTPLVVGIDRGVVLPLVRPNEALLLVAIAALLLRGLLLMVRGEPVEIRPWRADLLILALAVASSVLPLLWMVARGEAVVVDDLLYAATLWKYYGLYLVVRTGIRQEAQVRVCLWITLAAGAVVALLGVLQALQLFGVPEVLARWYAPGQDETVLYINRGTSTLAQSISVGDVMTFDLAIALALLFAGERFRRLLLGLIALFVLGALASGQFSAVIGLAVGSLVVAVRCGRLGKVLTSGALLLAPVALVLAPVLQTRVSGIDASQGMPQSWVVRIENLERFFWPRLGEGANWVFGVRPSARVPAPEVWREYVYIESGHTWLLWNGGVPLLLAFFAFSWWAAGATARVAHDRHDAIGVAAVAACAATWVIVVLMLFDPHLTMRGTADLFFPLLALALTATHRRPAMGDRAPPGQNPDRTAFWSSVS